MKKKINILNFNENKKIKFLHKNKKKYFYLGPWNKSNFLNNGYKLNNMLNMYSFENTNKQKQEIIFQKKTFDALLNLLVINLNKIHKKNFSKKFWDILLHRWLRTWIKQVYFRWLYVNKINKKYNIQNLVVLSSSLKKNIPINTLDAHLMHRGSDEWNELTFYQIINYQNKNKLKNIEIKSFQKSLMKKNNIIKYPKFSIFNNTKKLFFYAVEMNKFIKFKIRKKNNFFTLNFFSNENLLINNNILMREKFNKLFIKNKKKTFKNFLIKNLKDNLPKIFLENFHDLEKIYLKSKWPDKPEYILTSYGQYYDELFKYFIAKKKEVYKKTKLLILQHGSSNFYLCNDFYSIYDDRRVSDKYLSWGKIKFGQRNNTTFFYPKLLKSKFNVDNLDFKKNKKILIFTYNFSCQLIDTPNGSINGNISNQITLSKLFKFIKLLKHKFQNNISLRNLNINNRVNFEKIIQKKYNFIKFESQNKNFLLTQKKFDLFIHLYFGTVFFETMLINKPTIIIYNKKTHIHFDKKFNSYIKKLKTVNILFEREELAASFLLKKNDNLKNWWEDKKLQKVRTDFCSDYCLPPNKPLEIFQKIIN